MFRARLALFLFATLIPTAFGQQGVTTRASLSSAGEQGDGGCGLSGLSMSGDGRYVAFTAAASNLVPDDTNAVADVFVRDLLTGQTSRISLSSAGEQGNGESRGPAISANGRYVAFESIASNLVPNDTNSVRDIFVHDLQTGQTSRVSVSSSGQQSDGNSGVVSNAISADGRYVAFPSSASNLVPGDTNHLRDVFVHDRQTGQTIRVSVSSLGEQAVGGNGTGSNHPSMSADGRFVAFDSSATNLIPNDWEEGTDAFLHDMQTGVTSRIASAGFESCIVSSISADGWTVAFFSIAPLVPGDTNGSQDVFVLDRSSNHLTRASVSSTGEQATYGAGGSTSISAYGRYVAFTSSSTNLVEGDTNGSEDVFVRDRQTSLTTRVSLSSAGEQGDNHSFGPSISSDGRYLAFASYASNIVPADTNGYADVFKHQYGPTLDVQPSSYIVTSGFRVSGDLPSLFSSEDDCLGIFPDDLTLIAQVEISGESPTHSPLSLTFTFEGSVARLGLSQTIDLYNYATNHFDAVDGRIAPIADTMFEITLTYSVRDHTGPSGELRARITWAPINDEDPAQDGWLHCIDLVHWQLE